MYKFQFLFLLLIVGATSCDNNKVPAGYQNMAMEAYLKEMPKDIILLDVRTPDEYAEGFIPNSLNIDFKASDFAAKLDGLDVNKSYVVYCRSGRRSVGACEQMTKKGFNKLVNLEGGYLKYQELNKQ